MQVEQTGIGEQKTNAGLAYEVIKNQVCLLERQTEHTNPISTTFRWQKHDALKSTCPLLGTVMTDLSDAGEEKAIYRTVRA